MQFFLDTADLKEIERGLEWGMVDGITTNPSLIAKQGKRYLPTVQEIARLVPGPVSGEVLATDFDGIMEQARRLAGPARSSSLTTRSCRRTTSRPSACRCWPVAG